MGLIHLIWASFMPHLPLLSCECLGMFEQAPGVTLQTAAALRGTAWLYARRHP